MLTEFWMLNTGGSPKDAVESTLSSILEVNVPEKYYLSGRACEGILRRAERRGKQLPEMLRIALEMMIERERALMATTETSPEPCLQPLGSTAGSQLDETE